MSHRDHDFESLKKSLASCEPLVSESLADDVLRDVDAVLSSPKQHGPQRFNAQVHCTKKSRYRATFLGLALGASLGLLIGVTLTFVAFGSREGRIVYVEVPVETQPQSPQKRESRPIPEPDIDRYDRSLIARADTTDEPFPEIDRLIEETIAHKQRIVIPDSLRSQYVERRYASSPCTFPPDQNLLLLQRELLEHYR